MDYKAKAARFGRALDQDDFETAKSLLSDSCEYFIGEDVLKGPQAIVDSYEKNMLEGRAKLDELEWGKSEVSQINERSYYVHFTDYLGHKGKKHIFRCKQLLNLDENGMIVLIRHISDEEEEGKLGAFYVKVGLK